MNNIEKLDLNGCWNFYETGEEEKYPVTVPGSVISGMLENSLMEDPFYGTNEYPTREMLRKDFTFERQFEFDGDIKKNWELVMEGIDTIADVYLNDVVIAHPDNMHRTFIVNVNKYLKSGVNTIRIAFTSPLKYIESVKPQKGKEIHYASVGAIQGNQYIRKSHSMFGWDWGPQLPDMGIFRSIYLRCYEEEVLDYIHIKQEHGKENKVYITVSGLLRNPKGKESYVGFGHDNKKYRLKVTVLSPDGDELVKDVDGSGAIEIENARLWWPNRLGEQPLYTVKATLVPAKENETEMNTITERIGLRTFEVSQEADVYGREFAFKINGSKIFAKGADYIPDDCVYSRITKEKLKYLIDSCVDAGFNCIRVWGGGFYPSDEFYDLCDEAGLIVWQDFMFACNIYELNKKFEVNITAEATDNVRRLRNHAALGLWCGNNECESAWEHWGDFKSHSKALKNDYLRMFAVIIPKVVEKEDGQRFYWPSSPSSFGTINDPDSDDVGDRHYWEVWHGMKPFNDYENHYFRFCSEFGFQSFPEMATVKKFAGEGDLNIFSEVMESHQKNGTANAKILHYISENFLYPNTFEHLIYVSQVLQGMAIKHGVEHWRRNRGRCMGALYWQLNDNWPVASWASIDYYGRWKALHYMAKRFYADVLGSVQRTGCVFTPYISNETFKGVESEVKVYVKTMDNEVVFASGQTIKAKALSSVAGEKVDITSAVAHRESSCYVEIIFNNSDGTVTRQVEPVLEYKHTKLPKTKVDITVEKTGIDTVEATVTASGFSAFTALMSDTHIVWDDNYFFITDTEPVKVKGRIIGECSGTPEVKVITLSDSYEN